MFIYTEESDKGIIAILSLFHGYTSKRGGKSALANRTGFLLARNKHTGFNLGKVILTGEVVIE